MKINNKELTDENIQKLWNFWLDKCTSICECCEHYIPKYFKCSPETCEYYEEYEKLEDIPEMYSQFACIRPFNCQNLEFATCKALKGTVCEECSDNGMSHFSWNGNIIINKYD